MKIYIGSDHGGYKLKEELKNYLGQLGHEVEDMGAHTLDPDDDYPDFVIPAAEKVALRQAQGELTFGVVIGRSGQGEAMVANKVKGIRTALCLDERMARLAREHNDANVLSLGADFVNVETAKKIVKVFLETPFLNEKRHARRLKKMTAYETKGTKLDK